MELFTKQNQIVEYIKTHFKTDLSTYYKTPTDFDAYIQDFVNLDKYQKSKQCFFDWSNYSFDTLSLDSMVESCELHILLTFKNGTPAELHEQMMIMTPIFYNMVSNSAGFGGIVDFVEITNIEFFEAADTDKNLKVADLTLSIKDEINTI